MSLKLENHLKLNIIKTEIWHELNCQKKLSVTETEMSLKLKY